MIVNTARRAGQPGLERAIDLAHRLPVRLQVHHRAKIKIGRPLRVLQRGNQRRRRDLGRRSRHRSACHIDRIHAGVDRSQKRGQLTPGGVMRMQVYWQVEVLP